MWPVKAIFAMSQAFESLERCPVRKQYRETRLTIEIRGGVSLFLLLITNPIKCFPQQQFLYDFLSIYLHLEKHKAADLPADDLRTRAAELGRISRPASRVPVCNAALIFGSRHPSLAIRPVISADNPAECGPFGRLV